MSITVTTADGRVFECATHEEAVRVCLKLHAAAERARLANGSPTTESPAAPAGTAGSTQVPEGTEQAETSVTREAPAPAPAVSGRQRDGEWMVGQVRLIKRDGENSHSAPMRLREDLGGGDWNVEDLKGNAFHARDDWQSMLLPPPPAKDSHGTTGEAPKVADRRASDPAEGTVPGNGVEQSATPSASGAKAAAASEPASGPGNEDLREKAVPGNASGATDQEPAERRDFAASQGTEASPQGEVGRSADGGTTVAAPQAEVPACEPWCGLPYGDDRVPSVHSREGAPLLAEPRPYDADPKDLDQASYCTAACLAADHHVPPAPEVQPVPTGWRLGNGWLTTGIGTCKRYAMRMCGRPAPFIRDDGFSCCRGCAFVVGALVPIEPTAAPEAPIPTKYDCTCRECKAHNRYVDELLAATAAPEGQQGEPGCRGAQCPDGTCRKCKDVPEAVWTAWKAGKSAEGQQGEAKASDCPDCPHELERHLWNGCTGTYGEHCKCKTPAAREWWKDAPPAAPAKVSEPKWAYGVSLTEGWAFYDGEAGEEDCTESACADYARVVNSDKGMRLCYAHAKADGAISPAAPAKVSEPGKVSERMTAFATAHVVAADVRQWAREVAALEAELAEAKGRAKHVDAEATKLAVAKGVLAAERDAARAEVEQVKALVVTQREAIDAVVVAHRERTAEVERLKAELGSMANTLLRQTNVIAHQGMDVADANAREAAMRTAAAKVARDAVASWVAVSAPIQAATADRIAETIERLSLSTGEAQPADGEEAAKALTVQCPTCGWEAGKPCLELATAVPRGPHPARIAAAIKTPPWDVVDEEPSYCHPMCGKPANIPESNDDWYCSEACAQNCEPQNPPHYLLPDAIKAAVTAANNRAADAFHEWKIARGSFAPMNWKDFETWLRSGGPAPGAVKS